MNLFAIVCGPARTPPRPVVDALRGMVDVFPQLRPESLDVHALAPQLTIACLPAGEAAPLPPAEGGGRRYVASDQRAFVCFDGAVIDSLGALAAHDAALLAAHWDTLPGRLEGRFVAIRHARSCDRVDILLDPLGKYPLFWARRDGLTLISNSVSLIRRALNLDAIDPLGAAMQVGIGWAGGDRTLVEGIRAFLGGGAFSVSIAAGEIRPGAGSGLDEFSRPPRKSRDVEHVAGEAAGALSAMIGRLRLDFPELRCTVTGGRDSRLLLALCLRAGFVPRCHTRGVAGAPDVLIATQVARALHLEHDVESYTAADLAGAWFALAARLLEQTDGMVSVWQAADVMGQPQQVAPLGYTLGGIGGEIARAYYARPEILSSGCSGSSRARTSRVVSSLGKIVLAKGRVLLTADAVHEVRAALKQRLLALRESVGSVADLPDLFYAVERVRRWGGANARKVAPAMDTFAPFATRPFLRAAFQLPVEARIAESLHHRIIRQSSARLHALAFDKGAWLTQRLLPLRLARHVPWLLERILRRRKGSAKPGALAPTPAPRETAFRTLLGALRERCLAQVHSPLWDVIDRRKVERMTTPSGFEAEGRRHLEALHNATTVLLYAAGRR